MTGKDPIFFPVWPYFFLSGLALAIAVSILINWAPPWRPDKAALVHLEGPVEKMEIRDHISDTSAGAVWPMLTSAYFTLEGHEGEFRYPYTHADYIMVRDNTSGFVEVWVDGAEMDTGAPVMIWQIREHSEHNELYDETDITFETIAERMDAVGQSRHRLALNLIFAAVGLWGLGRLVKFWNRRRNATRQT